jgi:hypothetical protein
MPGEDRQGSQGFAAAAVQFSAQTQVILECLQTAPGKAQDSFPIAFADDNRPIFVPINIPAA